MKEIIPLILQLGTLVLSILIVLYLVVSLIQFLVKKPIGFYQSINRFLANNYLIIGFWATLVAMLGSLFYSDIMWYEPCKLCWYQRIFIYSQVFLFGIALFIKNKVIVINSLVLSVIGIFIAIYHYLIQTGIIKTWSCSVAGDYTASCSDYFVMAYGYITIPMMAITILSLVIIAGIAYKKLDK